MWMVLKIFFLLLVVRHLKYFWKHWSRDRRSKCQCWCCSMIPTAFVFGINTHFISNRIREFFDITHYKCRIFYSWFLIFLETLSSTTRPAGKELLPVFPIQSSPEMPILGYVKGGLLRGNLWSEALFQGGHSWCPCKWKNNGLCTWI